MRLHKGFQLFRFNLENECYSKSPHKIPNVQWVSNVLRAGKKGWWESYAQGID
jgi:hypothetical protein